MYVFEQKTVQNDVLLYLLFYHFTKKQDRIATKQVLSRCYGYSKIKKQIRLRKNSIRLRLNFKLCK